MTAKTKNQAFSYSFERLLSESSRAPIHADRIAETVMKRISEERGGKKDK